MIEQVYGIFASADDAERAIGALKDHGADDNDISVIRRSDGVGLPQVEHESDTSLSVTTPGDTVAGAVKGGAAGLALGLLASAAALAVPGIGPVLAAGPLAAALAATAATTGAGALGGGLIGSLIDQGVPEHAATNLSEGLGDGGILVAVRSEDLTSTDAELLLQKYGATRVTRHVVGSSPDNVTGPLDDHEADLLVTADRVDETAAAAGVSTAGPV